jgi:hypothetical protein
MQRNLRFLKLHHILLSLLIGLWKSERTTAEQWLDGLIAYLKFIAARNRCTTATIPIYLINPSIWTHQPFLENSDERKRSWNDITLAAGVGKRSMTECSVFASWRELKDVIACKKVRESDDSDPDKVVRSSSLVYTSRLWLLRQVQLCASFTPSLNKIEYLRLVCSFFNWRNRQELILRSVCSFVWLRSPLRLRGLLITKRIDRNYVLRRFR